MKKIYTKFLIGFLFVLGTVGANAQIGVTVTGNTNTTPNLAASYPSVAAAITDLNLVTAMTGPVVFDLSAGATESNASQLTITTAGNASFSIIFQKSGAGANPVLTRSDAGVNATTVLGGLGDGIIRIDGTDNLVFDGLDLAASNQGIEYGYYTHKPSAINACQGLTIRNCTITMTKGTSAVVAGIYIGNGSISVTSATGVIVTANSGRTENVTITGNTISNVHAGIICRGSSAATFSDQNFIVGQSGGGNTIQNFGGGSATTTYGVYFIYTNNANVDYNTINNAGGGGSAHASTFYGIFYSTVTGVISGNNNAFTVNTSGTSAVQVIYNSNAVTSNTFSNNTFAGTIAATSTSYLIYANSATPAVTISGNQTSGTFTKTGATGAFYCYYNFGGPASGTETITNNNFSNLSTTGTSSTNGIYSNTATGQNRVCSGNTINNWTVGSGSTYGIYCLSALSNQVFNNTVSNITGTTNTTFVGLYFTGTNPTVYGNTVFGLSNAGTVHGIQSGGSGTVNLYKNKVYGLSSSSVGTTAGLVTGIIVSTIGTSTNIYNNLVGNLSASVATGGDAVRGISFTGTTAATTINLSFNTIYLTGTGGAGFGSSGVLHTYSATPTSASLVMKNNIIVNGTTPNGTGLAVAFRRSAATSLANYSTSSNNNLFYSGTPGLANLLFYDGTNADQTLVDLKARLTPGESASITENPNFVSTTGSNPTYLHINTTIATQIESAGVTIGGITDDFDGDVRNATTPDIGADEFAGIAADITGPSISYTVFGNSLCLNDRTLSPVTITDGSGVNIAPGTRPRLYYKKLTNANTFVDNTSGTDGWKYVEATGAGGSPFSFTTDYSLLFGGVAAGDSISYFVVAQDLASTPNVGINSGTFAATPTSVALTATEFPLSGTINGYRIITGGLSGSVNVGPGETYLTLSGAGGLFSAINAGGLTGNLTADITGNITTEDGANALNAITYGCAGTYTLIIKPAAAVTATVSGSSTGAIIKLNGADNVTIDGSNNGTSSKDLTITNTNTATSGNAMIWLASASASDGATNNNIKNCIITGNSETTTQMGIFSGGTASMSTTASALANNANNTIQNNTISKSQYGVFVRGVAAATLGTGLQVIQNTLGTATAGDGFSLTGVTVQFQDGAIISNNEIQNQTSTSAANSGGIILLDTKNGTLNANNIHNLRYTGTSTGKIVGIHTSSSTYNVVGNPSNITFSNNMVYDLSSTATSSSWNTSGISNNGGYNDKYYYNSVYLTGQMSNTGTGGSACFANGNGLTSSNCPVVDMRNNIFYMNGSSAVSATLYAHYTTVTTYSGSTLNYNDLLSSASGAALAQLGRFNSTNYATLAAWQAATAQEANSISGDPRFISATDLHINTAVGTPVESAGTPIAGITTDFDNDTRNATTPDIGADEGTFIVPPANDIQATAFISPVSGGSVVTGAAFSPQASFTNNGTATQTNVTVRYRIVDAALIEVYNNMQVIASIAPGVTTTVTFASTSLAIAGTYTIYARSELAGDAVPANDEINGTLLAEAPLCGTYMVGVSQPAGFQNLTQAIGRLNALGVSCAVVFELQADYATAPAETFPLVINAYAGASAANTFTIRPATGVTATISGTSTSSIIKLNGADYVTIDGSNNGSTSRNLTIENTAITSNTAAIWVASLGTGTGATFNTIKNANIKAGSNTVTSTFGIYAGGTTISTTGTGDDNDDLTILNDSIYKSYYGIYARASATGLNNNVMISSNSIGSSNATVYIGKFGIDVTQATGANISANTIINIIGTITNPTGMLIGTGFVNSLITQNKITGLRYTGTSGYGGKGIDINTGTASSNVTISNNMIADLLGDGWSALTSDAIVGIRILGTTGGLNIYYNSVNLTGNADRTTATVSAALYVVSTATSLDIRNNIFANSIVNALNAGGKAYSIYSAAANTAFTVIDYNDYYPSGTQGVLGYLTSDRNTIAAWRTATAQDANSISVQPNFVSPTNLHLVPGTNCGLNGYGTPIAGITTDYDNDTRDASTPDMGADEFTATYSGTLAGVAGSATCEDKLVSPAGTTYATGVCDLIARIVPSGADPVAGKINVCVTLDATQQYFNGQPYVQRHYDLEPTTSNQTSTSATVTLYFTDAEFALYNSNNPVRPPLPTVANGGNTDPNRANVKVTQFHGTATTSPSSPGNYTGGRVLILPAMSNILWDGSYWAITFDIIGFSGFYIHTSVFNSPLPITINYFNGTKQGYNHLLNWKVTCISTPRVTMMLERSNDSRNFISVISSISADAARCNQPFDYTDNNPLPGMNYYRLKVIDADGKISYSSIVALLNAAKGFDIISIAPNPVVNDHLTLNVTAAQASKMELVIFDMQGRMMNRQTVSIAAGFSSIPMLVDNLAAGTYTLFGIVDGDKSKVTRFVKQ